MGEGTVYRCSDGRYYGDVDVWQKLESGAWTPCCWDAESGKEWMSTRQEELLLLVPAARSSLPDRTRVEHVATGLSIAAGQEMAEQR